MKLRLILSLALTATGFSAPLTERTATLILPSQVTVDGGYLTASPTVEIVWDGDEPVAVDVALGSQQATRSQPSVVGSWRLFYAGGKEVERPASIGMRFVRPDGAFVLKKGEHVRLKFVPNSPYTLSKAGRYYAIAEFTGTCRNEKIRFVTEKRWFEITDIQ
jgi:hypothetical protein